MQVVSLNIRHGGRGILESLFAEHDPDVIAFSEWCPNVPGAVLKAGLEAMGFQTATSSTNGGYGVLVAAKRPFASRCCTPSEAANGALLIADFDGLRMMTAYFPQKQFKRPFFASCQAQAMASNSVPFLLIGDINTGRNDIDREPNGTPFACVDLFKSLPLTDLWRAQHGDAARDWTWFSRPGRNGGSNGFRLDHAFANAAFLERFSNIRCDYDHAPRLSKLTDHSALVLTVS
jgi:exodeoxyribonuclease III